MNRLPLPAPATKQEPPAEDTAPDLDTVRSVNLSACRDHPVVFFQLGNPLRPRRARASRVGAALGLLGVRGGVG